MGKKEIFDGEVTIRDASPADSLVAGRLIHAAGPALFDAMFGPSPERVKRLFADLFRLPKNPFSYEYAFLAEQNGEGVGIALAASSAQRQASGSRMLWLLPRYRGFFPLLRRMPDAFDLMRCTTAPPEGAYYLSILAVAPQYQRQGIGTQMITEVVRRAVIADCTYVALHAELGNMEAQRFYLRHGFVRGTEYRTKRAARLGITGLVAMQRAIK